MPRSRRLLVTPLMVIAVMTAVTATLLIRWRSQLPDPLTTHFGIDGSAQGSSSWSAHLVTTLVLTGGLPLPIAIGNYLAPRGPGSRLLASLSCAIAVFIPAMMLLGTAGQRGLADAQLATLAWSNVVASVFIGTVAGVLAYRGLPRHEAIKEPEPAQLSVPLAPQERVSWCSHRRSGVGAWLAVALFLAAVVVFAVRRDTGLLITLTVAAAIVGVTASVRVRIDSRGLTYYFGLFRRHYPLDSISEVRAVEVNPVDYGGWGYRLSHHGVAIVLGKGPGLTISRAGHTDLTITVPDAHTGAALATSLLASKGNPS